MLDPQEKAYYDRNKDLLHDKDTIEFFQKESITIDLSQYMDNSLWQDNQSKYYQLVNKIVNKIAEQEYESTRILMRLVQNNSIKISKKHYQQLIYRYTNTLKTFGDDNSDNNDVIGFYQQWTSFSTIKLFKNADKYNGEGENSKIRSLVDKENENFRVQARNNYNQSIREFIQYIQQFDKRVKRIQQEKLQKQKEQQEQIQKEIEQRKQNKILKQNQAITELEQRLKLLEQKIKDQTATQAEILEYERLTLSGQQQTLLEKEKMWSQQEKQFKQTQQKDKDDIDYNQNISQEDRDLGLRYNQQTKKLFCNICNQQFQMQGQFKSHLTSKKHKKALEELHPKQEKEQKQVKHEKSKSQVISTKDTQEAENKQKEQNNFKCLKCNQSFPSKTKLFEHIRKTGHAALKVDVEQEQKGKKHKK